MKKIKIKPQEKRVVGKEFNPVDFFNTYKQRIIRFGVSIGIIILCLLALWRLQENKRSNAIILITQAKDLFFSGKYETSLGMYRQFLKQFPGHSLTPAALSGVAYCYEELGNDAEAKKVFQKIKDDFPNSPWV